MKYPVGIQDFEKIRREGYVYVDKTAQIAQLINSGCYYFLCRPRRFGKSLLLSTIAAWFGGRKDLFQGLSIAEQSGEPEAHPVLRLDLGGKEYKNYTNLLERLDLYLTAWENLYGKNQVEVGMDDRFFGIIRRACKQTGRQVVILIDEYDKPLLEAIGNEPLREAYRSTLRGLYGNLKTCDECIKFALLTGVTKFSKLSIFSDLNNLKDISMYADYATLCGITEQELETYFAPGIEDLARRNGISSDEAREQLKRRYDGYLFEEHAESVYNPFSLLSALDEKKFRDYWFGTGTPKFLVEVLQRDNINLENLTIDSIAASRLSALDSLEEDLLPVLYQSGYLTIAAVHPRTGNYRLKFPNEEVEHSFFNLLLPAFVHKKPERADTLLERLVTALDEGHAETFMIQLEALLADIPYEHSPVEAYFRNLVFIIFRLVGFYCEVEHPVAGGRSDVVIKAKDFIYVLELKVDQSAEAALRQIEEKGYAVPYAADPRKLFMLGVNFSTKSKQIDEWRIVEA